MRRWTSRDVDIAAGTVFALVGVYVVFSSLRLDFYVEGVPGPGFFPLLLAIALGISGCGLAVGALRKSRRAPDDFELPSRSQAKRALSLWIAILVASLLVQVVGFLVAMFLLVAVILLGIERRRGLGTVATIVVTPVLAYLLFATLLQVPLPAGPFGS